MNEVTEILLKAKEKISKPENWCQRSVARDPEGCRVSARDPNASSWCSIGAVLSSTKGIVSNTIHAKLREIFSFVLDQSAIYRGYSIPAFNDHPEVTHDDVMTFFDLAIEKSKEIQYA